MTKQLLFIGKCRRTGKTKGRSVSIFSNIDKTVQKEIDKK